MTTTSLALGGADHVSGLFLHFPCTILPMAPGGRHCRHSHWTDKETEAQRGQGTQTTQLWWVGGWGVLFTLQPGQWAVQVLTLLISPDLGSVNIYQGPGPAEGGGGQSENVGTRGGERP